MQVPSIEGSGSCMQNKSTSNIIVKEIIAVGELEPTVHVMLAIGYATSAILAISWMKWELNHNPSHVPHRLLSRLSQTNLTQSIPSTIRNNRTTMELGAPESAAMP